MSFFLNLGELSAKQYQSQRKESPEGISHQDNLIKHIFINSKKKELSESGIKNFKDSPSMRMVSESELDQILKEQKESSTKN